jgi:hypothetical protein
MKVVFIADFFAEDVLGGGELNNHELIQMLVQDGIPVKKVHSHLVTKNFIEQNKNSKFIVANFFNLLHESIAALYDKEYIIYEHDHKYLITRDPSPFKDFLAPKELIINHEFYKRANAVLCQSRFHLDIVKKNLKINNLINLSGNLWSEDSLNVMLNLSDLPKSETCAIMNSTIEHKNTREAIMYCQYKKKPFKLIESGDYKQFLRLMGENKTFVFFPKTPETLSRTVVEARMMGMSVIVNKMIGATGEPWYDKKGPDLIEFMRTKRMQIKETVMGTFS